MKRSILLAIISNAIVCTILFIILRIFNCYVYQVDYPSVLFGMGLLTITISLQKISNSVLDEIVYMIESNKYRKMLDKRLQEWEDNYKNESK